MKVVVTGASGFIGSHLVRALSARGDEVVAISRRKPESAVSHWHALDVLGDEARRVSGQADAIVHLAALSDASLSLREPLRYSQVNALGALNMLEAARARGAMFILASSQRVYAPSEAPLPEGAPLRPTDPYGHSKVVAEQWLRMYRNLYQLPATALRFFSVYGPGQGLPGGTSGVVSILLHRAATGEDIWVDGGKRRDLTHVDDVVQGILLALAKRERCEAVYNVATGVGIPLEDLGHMVLEATGARSRLHVRETQAADDLVADIALARKELDYSPRVGLREGLERTFDWLTTR